MYLPTKYTYSFFKKVYQGEQYSNLDFLNEDMKNAECSIFIYICLLLFYSTYIEVFHLNTNLGFELDCVTCNLN